ncbi:MAG: tryptophan--tRNA ligase [Patescibacteria group bacterium]
MNKQSFTTYKKRVLAGMRATGRLHLGNYLGGAKGMLTLQENPEYETLYMVADMHGITTPYKTEGLKKNKKEIILDYLAIGLDPEKSIIFEQSEINLHGELAFYLSSVVTVNRMQDLPTYKDKVKQYPEHNTLALLNYPALMAADILIYKASLVPVGVDQEPHLEVAREIARKMNNQYDMDFAEPQRFKTSGDYVPSLTGEGKMSKSVEGSFISLTDDLKTITKKIAGAPTDSGKGDVLPKTGGVANLFKFVELFQGENRRKEYEQQYLSGGIKYGDLKNDLAQAIFTELTPIQERRKQLELKPEYVEEVLKKGATKARQIAQQTINEVKQKMGLM